MLTGRVARSVRPVNLACLPLLQRQEEGQTARLLRLTDHVRKARSRLLHQEFNYDEHGEFGSETVSHPLYRHMRDEWAATGHAPTEASKRAVT